MTKEKKQQSEAASRGEKVVLSFCTGSAVLGALPFATGPLLLVSDYTLFLAVKRVMDGEFEFNDVFSLVAPTVKAQFAFGLFKGVADAFAWSWWVTIPVGALVAASTTYALGMCFVHFNAKHGELSAEEAAVQMHEDAFTYLREKTDAPPSLREQAERALAKMWERGGE